MLTIFKPIRFSIVLEKNINHLSKSILLISAVISTLLIVSSCGKKLEAGVVYEFHSQSQTSEVGAKVNTESSEYDLKTKDFSVYFRIFENGLTDLILKSDSINYSFSGEYRFLEGKGEYGNVYSLILNGKDFNTEYGHPTMFSFVIDPSESRVYSMSNGTFPKLSETFFLSKLSGQDYKNEYQDGLKNSFLPMVLTSLYLEEVKNLDDYWIEYLGITNKTQKRVEKEQDEFSKGEKSNFRSNQLDETGNTLVDLCKCLTEPGNSEWATENKDVCRDAISKDLGVENWEKVNFSKEPELNRKWDLLAEKCTGSKHLKTGIEEIDRNSELIKEIGRSYGYIWESITPQGTGVYATLTFDGFIFRTIVYSMNGKTNSKDFTVVGDFYGKWNTIDNLNAKGVYELSDASISWRFNDDYTYLTNNKGVVFHRVKMK